MKLHRDILIALLIATIGVPAQAKFIGTEFYKPGIMLDMCTKEVARGEAGFCTGYVIATLNWLVADGKVCAPQGIEYEDMLLAVIDRIEKATPRWRTTTAEGEVYEGLIEKWPCQAK